MRNSHFRKGSSTFLCRCCGHLTRETGDQALGSETCPICWDLAGYENMMFDGLLEDDDKKDAIRLFAKLRERSEAEWAGAKVSFERLFEKLDIPLTFVAPPKKITKREIANLEDANRKALKSVAPKYRYTEGMTAAQKKSYRAKMRRQA